MAGVAQCEPYAESVEAPEEQPLRASTVSVRHDERRYQPRIADDGQAARHGISSAHRSAHGPSAVRGATVTPSARR